MSMLRKVFSVSGVCSALAIVGGCDDDDGAEDDANRNAPAETVPSGGAPSGSGTTASNSNGTPTVANLVCGTDTGTGCAPESQRVDLYVPSFSNPLQVTNPLFPIANLQSVVFTGQVDGEPFRSETTLLPETKRFVLNGREVETLTSQYMAFADGRLEEIALDWYAQDDNGAVWYFGEDVADYDEDGVIFTHEGTWAVGRDDAPLAMIMPAQPQAGQVYRAETIAPIAWEEVTVQALGVTVEGPAGPIAGAMIGSELHMEGTHQEKVFAPGYGEFSTGSLATDDLEALALAVPVDALSGQPPPELDATTASSADIFDAAAASDWDGAVSLLDALMSGWDDYASGAVPPRLESEMLDAVESLADALDSEDAAETRQSAIAVARVAFDLRLRYRPPAEIDTARLDLWLAQLLVDAAANERGSVRGDAATAALVWNRIAHTFAASTSSEISNRLAQLGAAAASEDVPAAVNIATQLRANLASNGWK